MIESCTTASNVIDALDGTTAVARLIKRKPQHVTNWRATGRLPAWTFLILSQALGERGRSAPAALWGIDEPAAAPPIAPCDDPSCAADETEVRRS